MAYIDIVVAISVCMDFYFEISYFSDETVIDHTLTMEPESTAA